MKKKFVLIEHTADIGIKVEGRTLEELYENSAYGMFSIIADIDKTVSTVPREKVNINLKAVDKEILLVSWLNELTFLMTTNKILFSEFKVKKIKEETYVENCSQFSTNIPKYVLTAEAMGEKIDLNKHSIHLEIKAATYHNLKIENPKPDFYHTSIIFDV